MVNRERQEVYRPRCNLPPPKVGGGGGTPVLVVGIKGHPSPAQGTPPPPPVDKQTENITSRRTSYAGGND